MGFRSSGDVEMFNMMFYSLVAGITFLWLFAHKLGNRNRLLTFLLAFALMTMLNVIGVISYCGLQFSQDAVMGGTLLAILGFVMLLGFVLSGWCCRKHYGPVRFTLWLAVWIVSVCIVSMLVVYSTVFIIQAEPVPISTVLLMVSFAGAVLGGCMFVMVLPYMIVVLRSSFFRERLYACLNLKSVRPAVGQAATDAFTRQNPHTETARDNGPI